MTLYSMALADKKNQMQWMLRPAQIADLAPLPEVVARQKCVNWGWAAATEAALLMEGLPLSQTELVTRVYGSDVCADELPTPDQIGRAASTEIRLGDGRRFRLQARFRPGAPAAPEALIVSVRHGIPPVLFWRGRAYLVAGITYDEYIARTGTRRFEIRELRLLDPLASADKKPPDRFVTFVKGRDDSTEISGVLELSVAPAP